MISFNRPVKILLQDNTEITVTNQRAATKQAREYGVTTSVGYNEIFDKNQLHEKGTITYQAISDINGDASPPVISISGNTIYDQDPITTLEDFATRQKSRLSVSNRNNSFGIPSINLSGALFDSIVGSTLTVQQSVGGSNPLEKFPTQGKIQINKEVISYTSKTTTTLDGISRAQDGTSVEIHAPGDYLRSFTI